MIYLILVFALDMVRVFPTPFVIIYLNEILVGIPRMNMMILEILSIGRHLYKTSGLMRKVFVIIGMN